VNQPDVPAIVSKQHLESGAEREAQHRQEGRSEAHATEVEPGSGTILENVFMRFFGGGSIVFTNQDAIRG
jgi:hypothetical protein